MARQEQNVLQRINTELEEGWQAQLDASGRIYYINHKAQTTSWLPPRENWPGTGGLPYGWETGLDRNDKEYFINHVDHYTTRDDPRQDPDYVEPPRPREVELLRDAEKGFGFVAGSEKPVVVRFVTEGGPSEEKLLPGDQILKINGEEVRRAPREKVIELVRSCKESIVLTVCQPYTDNSSRKSALLTAAKKARLKNNPSRVRFADAVMVNGASITNPSPVESYVPFMPNVLKVFLENGQTKSFKYDNKTSVKDVVASLREKLNITCVHHFSLVLQNMKNNTGTAAKMTLLQDHETLAEIAARQGARYFRCLFRVTFVPKDAYDLLKEDPIAFEYFYVQCCNDVLNERFASEMKYDTALRLAALQIQQHAISNNMAGKISIKAVVKECGLDRFVSKSLLESMKGKDLKRMLSQYLKMNQNLAAPGQKQLTALQAKLHYMKIVGELKTFGSRVFMVTLLDKKTEAMLLVGPHSGISIVTNIKSYSLSQLADFEQLEQVKVTKDGETMHRVELRLKPELEVVSLGLLSEDAQNFVCLVAGYYRIFVDPERRLVERTQGKNTSDPDVPSYESVHRVQTSPWSYPEDLVSEMLGQGRVEAGVADNQHRVDLSVGPCKYQPDEEFLARVRLDLESPLRAAAAALGAGLSALDRPLNVATLSAHKHVPTPYPSPAPGHHKVKASGASPSSPATPTSPPAPYFLPSSAGPPQLPFEEGVTSFGASSFTTSTPTLPSATTADGGPARARLLESPGQAALNATLELGRRASSGASGQGSRSGSRSGSGSGSGSGPSPPPPPRSSSSSSSLSTAVFQDARGGGEGGSSDTDSLSNVDALERQPLLMLRPGPGADPGSRNRATPNGDLRRGAAPDVESDDTDSYGTPSGSPAKGRLLQRVSSVESGMHSFGLHSPDMLPVADVDFHTLTDVDVALLPPEVYNAIYLPDIIPPQKLYLDPDIIDLTNFPMLEAQLDDGTMIDFTALSSLPPPSFSGTSATTHPGLAQAPSDPRASRSHGQFPSLVRSASADHCPDFFDTDIDFLIAQYYVPPPPTSRESDSSQLLSKSFSGAIHHGPLGSADFEETISSLIIPPPPSSTSPFQPEGQAGDTVTSPTTRRSVGDPPAGGPPGPGRDRRKFRHQRSSSVDTAALAAARQRAEEEDRKRRSFDGSQLQTSGGEASPSVPAGQAPPVSLSKIVGSGGGGVRVGIRDDSLDTHEGFTDAESPATVSQKLHELLRSLPTLAPEVALDTSQTQQPGFLLHRTGSLRLPRSASLDRKMSAGKGARSKGGDGGGVEGGRVDVPDDGGKAAAQTFTGKATHRTLFSGASSLGRFSGRRVVSQEYLTSSGLDVVSESAGPAGGGERDSSASLPSSSASAPSPTPSESFASLKAKLKDYRDHLLRKNSSRKGTSSESGLAEGGEPPVPNKRKGSSSSNSSSGGSVNNDQEEGKGTFKRTNSFSRLLNQLSGGSLGRRSSKGSASAAPQLVAGDNWTLRDKRGSGGGSGSTGDLQSLFLMTNGRKGGVEEDEREEEKKKKNKEVGGDKAVGGAAPAVRDTLGLMPRSTLRPVTSAAEASQRQTDERIEGHLKGILQEQESSCC